ncbi:hypothetical protein EHS11_08885 [Leptospira ilyithenensis]|uniref:Lipoprotein n=2 Tax=Leptospira ilyithenensis TaxID=2484901 RepID=A0A4R9LRJ4_9LEPT|nr:hypothetical protein EHS11_08885 [Leptospira ilyithenensis]
MPKRYFSILGACLLLPLLLSCNDGSYDKKDSSSQELYSAILLTQSTQPTSSTASAPTEENLPQPAINTVEMTVGETKYVKILGICKGNLNVNGNDDVAISGNDLVLPSFYLHRVDFTKSTGVSLAALGTFILNVDMPGGGGYDPVSTCETKILENSATIYDIQVKKCAVDKIFGTITPATNTISFRARCTKGL